MKHPQKEIRHQLAEIAAYRRELEAQRDKLAERVEEIASEGRELDARLDRAEVLKLLELDSPLDIDSPD